LYFCLSCFSFVFCCFSPFFGTVFVNCVASRRLRCHPASSSSRCDQLLPALSQVLTIFFWVSSHWSFFLLANPLRVLSILAWVRVSSWVVVGVNTTKIVSPFHIQGADLYPLPLPGAMLASRSFYAPECLDDSDPFADASRCLYLQQDGQTGPLFDITSSEAPCPAPGRPHSLLLG
jgi:hypothetical protein